MKLARRSMLGALAMLMAGAVGGAGAEATDSLIVSSLFPNDFPQEVALVAVAEARLRQFSSPPGARLAVVFLALRPGVPQLLRLWHADVPARLRVTAFDAHPGVQTTMRQAVLFTRVSLHGGRRVGHEAVIGLAPEAPMAGVYLLVECAGLTARNAADRTLWMQALSDTVGLEWFDAQAQARSGDIPDSPLQAQARLVPAPPVPLPASRARTQWLR
jgi:hypothetical protein